jgi:STE24 endopeptidase
MLLMLACFSYFYQQENLYTAFGFNTQPTLIGLMIVFTYIMSPYNEVSCVCIHYRQHSFQLLSFMMTLMSRRMEFSADRFSTDLGYGSLLSSGLIKLGKDNLSLPIDDWLYSMWNHSHPPIPERIAAIRDRKRE